MTRPTYETEDTIAHQEAVAKRIAASWVAGVRRLPSYYIPKFVVLDGITVRAFLQIKCRTHQSDTYDTLLISAHKIHALQQLAQFHGVRGILAVQWIDKLGYVDTKNRAHWKLVWGGRTVDKRDAQDEEPVLHIPVHEFKRIDVPVAAK